MGSGESYRESFEKLPGGEQARIMLQRACGGLFLFDSKISPLVNSEETGELNVFDIEAANFPIVSVSFGGTRNYHIDVQEKPSGPAHVPTGFDVVDVREIK